MKKEVPELLAARKDTLNESMTVQRILNVLVDVLGYDRMAEIILEAQIKDGRADIAVKLDGEIRFIVEAKAAGIGLNGKFRNQTKIYASEGGIHWALLTNGVAWELFHLTFEDEIDYHLVFSIDLSEEPLDVDTVSGELGRLCRSYVKNGELDAYWKELTAVSAESMAKALFTEKILRLIRKNIHKKQKVLIDIDDVAGNLYKIFSDDAQKQIGPLHISRKGPKPKTKPPLRSQATAVSTAESERK